MTDRLLKPLSPAARLLLLNLALALAYELAARLGRLLAIGPSDVSAIWPPAGLALAALMLAGPRVLPGLLLGAWASQWMGFFAGQGLSARTLLGAGLLAAASVGQAALAAHLARRVPEAVATAPVRPPLHFALVAGGSSLLAATAAHAVLLAWGLVGPAGLLFSWVTWWVGDATGMLVVAPALLLWLHPALKARRVAVQAFPIISLGLGLTLFSTLVVGVVERNLHVERFRADGTRLAMALQNHIAMAERDLEILQRLFYRVELQADEFRTVTRPMLLRSPWQQHFAYLPQVTGAGRAAFEARHGGLSLRELSARESVVAAGQRAEYFPVLWTDPESGNEALLGIDHLADAPRADAIERARASGRIAASPPLHSLAQSATSELVQALYAPVAADGVVPEGFAQPVRGMVSATLDIGQLLRAAVGQMDIEGHHLLLYDPDAPDTHALEWPAGQDLGARNRAERETTLPRLTRGVHHAVGLHLGDRRWRLVMQPAWAGGSPWPGLLQLAVLAAGLAFTGLLTGFMVARRRHDLVLVDAHERLEQQVVARTHELAETNRSLRGEVAERQRAERELQVFRWLAESAHQGLAISELDGRIVYLNPALRGLIGDPDWVPASGRTVQSYLGHRLARVYEEETLPALRREGRWEGEWHVAAKGERPERWLMQSYFVLKDDLGQPLYMAALVTDITAQRKAEEQLHLFRLFAESADVGLGISGFDHRMLYMNPALQRMTRHEGWTPATSRSMLEYFTRAFRERFLAEGLPALQEHGVWVSEMHVRGRDGQPDGWFGQRHFVVKDDQGHPLCMANVTTDVTAQRQMESALRDARQRAEAANRAKSMFLANMSHEIRTPLNAVLGFTQILLADGSLPAEAHQRLEIILSAGQRLLGLINDVLDLAKIESGKLSLVLQPFDLHAELAEIAQLFAARVAAKGLGWQAALGGLPAPCLVQGDRGKVGQVVMNLLGNALKFTEHGQVALRAGREQGSAGGGVWIEVADTGPGMAEAELAEIFAPFSQGEAGRAKGGSGLGLVLSRDIARAMGGELVLHSRPGAGTTARVTLPLPAAGGLPAAQRPRRRGARLDPATPCRALVVEDDPASRELLVKLLCDTGCTVAEAEDGQAGLAACQAAPFDIVFSDIRMPRMSGVDMIHALRAGPATAALPVVAVTASSLEHERRFYIEIGFHDFVPKPFDFAEIHHMLARHAGVRFLPEAANDAPEDGPAAGAGTPPAPLDAAARTLLQQLQAAAAEGDPAQVRALLAALGSTAVDAARRRAWEEAARRYDFEGLEAAVRALLADAGPGGV